MKRNLKIYISIITLLFTSCNMFTESSSRSAEDILVDLSDVVLLIPAIQASLEFVDEDSALDSSRAIAPNYVTDDDSYLMAEYFGNSWEETPRTPDEVYEAKDAEIDSDGVLRIPSSGTISGIYGDSNKDFYMTMESESTTGVEYRIKLYIYPRDIFSIDYTYEEYIVDEDNTNTEAWAWSWFDEDGNYQDYISEMTYYRDGSYLDKESETEDDILYSNVKSDSPSLTFSIDDLISDYSAYIYPSSISDPTTETGTYSSKTEGFLKGTKSLKRDIVEYYTEDGDNVYSVLYMEGTKRNDITENVTRYSSDLTTGETNILSLNTNGSYYTELNRIFKTDTTYSAENHIWYKSISNSLDTDNAVSTYNELTQNSTDSTLYSGEIEYYWNSYGINYTYSLDSTTGLISDFSWLETTSRSLSSESIDLTDLEDISIDGSNWSFSGSYEIGELIGTYSYEGSDYEVTIYPEGLEIDGEYYDWE